MRLAALEWLKSAINAITAQGKEPPRRALRCGTLALILTFVALGSVPFTSSAQPSNSNSYGLAKPWDSFFSAAFTPSGKCYAVGAEGALLTSTDGGKTWTRRSIAQRGDLSWWDLYSIRFTPDGKAGWIGGENGLILKTTDGGNTWNSQPSGTTENIFRIAATDSRSAYASGSNGLLMSTSDGGAHWQQQIQKSGLIFFDIAFPDTQNGWAVGEFETILHTADGGKTWTPQMGGKRANFKLPALFAVRFEDAQHGWAAGQGGTLLRTDNGGANWQPVTSPFDSPMYSVAYASESATGKPTQLWGSGDGGALLRIGLAGGGPTIQTPTVFSLSDLAFNGDNGVAVGLGGTIVHTADGGAHWKVVTGN
jgi:photosystem II stability/assembly factor-like uncharacterized protein